MNNCELCKFNNPKATATAVVIFDGKLLVLKRNQSPFKGWWDLPGGYLQASESPQDALQREIKEELGIDTNNENFTKIGEFSGTAKWKNRTFPILSHAFLIDLKGTIKLNKENSAYNLMPLNEIKTIAFDSNKKILQFIKENFSFNLEEVRDLVLQLDSSTTIDEQSLYKAILNGFVSKIYDGEKLIGMGWIFIRQTMLRKQAVVEDMIVLDAYRGKGFGLRLMEDLIETAKKQNCDTMELTSGWHRKAAHGLYQKVGFKIHDTAHMLLQLK